MRRLFIALAIIAWAPPVWAQTDFVTGNLNTVAGSCTLGTDSAHISATSVGFGGAVFTIAAGSFVGTIGFYGSGDGGATWNALAVTPSSGGATVTSAAGAGAWQTNVSAYTHVCMLMSMNTSGAAVVKIHLSPISARVPGGGGGGSGGPTSLSSLTAATITPGALASGVNNLTWNWQDAAPGASFTIGETAASAGGSITGGVNNQSILQALTQPGSTATPLSISQGALSGGPVSALQVQSTWNNAATAFSGISFALTNTGSLNTSTLLNLLVNGTSMFNVNPAGNATAPFVTASSSGGASFRAAGNPALWSVQPNVNTVITGGQDGSSASVLGSFIGKGANNQNNGATSAAGGAFLQGGYLYGVGTQLGNYGNAEMLNGYKLGTVANVEDVVCGTVTQYTVSDCATTPQVNVIGIAVGTATPVGVVVEGQVPIRLDAAMTAIGDTVCLSTTTAGTGHDLGSQAVCPTAGAQLGIIVANSGSVQVGPTGSTVTTQLVTLSTTLPLVQLHFR